MAGVKGRSGGARPNSGPKRKVVADWQLANLLRFQARFKPEDIDAIADALKLKLRGADSDILKVLPYVLGAVPKEVAIVGDEERPLVLRTYAGLDVDAV